MSEAKSVVVTGAGAGIGRAILERLSNDGWVTVGLELDPKAAADAGGVPRTVRGRRHGRCRRCR